MVVTGTAVPVTGLDIGGYENVRNAYSMFIMV